MVFVTVVPRSSLRGSSSAGEFLFSFVMPRPSRSTNNSLSVGFPTQDSLPSSATSESPVTSTASSSWSPQLAGSLTDAVVRAIGNSIPAIISSIQSNASSHVSSSVPGVCASGAPQPSFSSVSNPSASVSDDVSSVASVTPSSACSYLYATVGHDLLELGPPRGSYFLHFRIAWCY